MLNQKGQGLSEYGVIFLLVVLIGTGVWFGFDVNGQDKGLYSTISLKLQSIIDDTVGNSSVAATYDTDVVSKQKTRGSPSYETSLKATINGIVYDLLWRYEDMSQVSKGKFSPTSATKKVYYLVKDSVANTANAEYPGSEGLMTLPYAPKLVAEADDYSSYGYTTGSDSDGTYKTTYFNLDGKTYQIKDYGTGGYSHTMLSEYIGSPTATVTNAATGQQTTVAEMADARTNYVNTTGIYIKANYIRK